MAGRSLWLAVVLCAVAGAAQAGEQSQLRLQWGELSPHVVNKKVAFVLPDGTHVEGKVAAVEADGLRMKVTKSSNKRTQPKGKQLVPRQGLTFLEVTDYRKLGRILGMIGAVGLAAGIVAAQDISIDEGPLIIIVPVVAGAGIVGSGIGGYYVGKRIDRRVTRIVIAP